MGVAVEPWTARCASPRRPTSSPFEPSHEQPKFSHNHDLLHLGTREIQLVLLKNALLVGCRFQYGAELVGLQAPPHSTAAGAATAAATGDGEASMPAAGLWSGWIKAKPASEMGLVAEEDEYDEYVKDDGDGEALASASGDGNDGVGDGGASHADEGPPPSPRGAQGGVAAAAAAFAARATAETAAPELLKHPRRSQGGGKVVLAAMAALNAARPEEPPPPPKGQGAGGGQRRSGAVAAAAALFGGVAGGDGGGAPAVAAASQESAAIDLSLGTLDFKPDKTKDYLKGAGQGKLNYMQLSELDPTFAIVDGDTPPTGATAMLPFDVLMLAEGEWSRTCSRLGVSKAMWAGPTKEPNSPLLPFLAPHPRTPTIVTPCTPSRPPRPHHHQLSGRRECRMCESRVCESRVCESRVCESRVCESRVCESRV